VSRTCFDILWPFIKINLCQQFNLEYKGKTDTANELYISTNKKSLKPGTPFQSKNPPLALISSRIPSGPYRKQYESNKERSRHRLTYCRLILTTENPVTVIHFLYCPVIGGVLEPFNGKLTILKTSVNITVHANLGSTLAMD
jgi:hypothetical protein